MIRRGVDAERAGRWAREKSRYEQLQWLKTRWLRFLLATLVVLAVSVALMAVRRDALMGIIVGTLITSWLWALAFLVLQETGTASTLMGAEAEADSARQLHAMERRGWRVFDAVPIDEHNRDLDHLAIGPPGVFAFETKWSRSDLLRGEAPWLLQRHIDQARQRANAFRMKRTAFGLRDTPVTPVLVLWGPAVDQASPAQRVREEDDVTVVAGPWLTAWASGLLGDGLDRLAIERAAKALEGFVQLREDHFRGPDRGRFVSGGLYGVFSDVWYGVLAAMAGAFLTLLVSAVLAGPSWAILFVIAGAIAGISWLVWLKAWRFPAVFGWAAGATASLPLAGSWWLAGVLA